MHTKVCKNSSTKLSCYIRSQLFFDLYVAQQFHDSNKTQLAIYLYIYITVIIAVVICLPKCISYKLITDIVKRLYTSPIWFPFVYRYVAMCPHSLCMLGFWIKQCINLFMFLSIYGCVWILQMVQLYNCSIAKAGS